MHQHTYAEVANLAWHVPEWQRRLRSTWLAALMLLAVGLPGCAWSNLSSAERRAGTYGPETVAEFNPRTGVVKFLSSGDDHFSLKDLQWSPQEGGTLASLDLEFKRAAVLDAQGRRAEAITPLLGQDLEANRIWSETTLGSLQLAASVIRDLLPALAALKAATPAQPGSSLSLPGGYGWQQSPVPATVPAASPGTPPTADLAGILTRIEARLTALEEARGSPPADAAPMPPPFAPSETGEPPAKPAGGP